MLAGCFGSDGGVQSALLASFERDSGAARRGRRSPCGPDSPRRGRGRRRPPTWGGSGGLGPPARRRRARSRSCSEVRRRRGLAPSKLTLARSAPSGSPAPQPSSLDPAESLARSRSRSSPQRSRRNSRVGRRLDFGVKVAVAFAGGLLALLSPCSALLLPAFFAYASARPADSSRARACSTLASWRSLYIPAGYFERASELPLPGESRHRLTTSFGLGSKRCSRRELAAAGLGEARFPTPCEACCGASAARRSERLASCRRDLERLIKRFEGWKSSGGRWAEVGNVASPGDRSPC